MDLAFILSLSILIPSILGAIRFQESPQPYRLFILLLWVGVVSEIFAFLLGKFVRNNAYSYNIYNIVEFIFLMFIFRYWRLWNNRKTLFIPFLTVSILFWIFDVFVMGGLYKFNFYFAIYYCFLIVIFAITQINKLIVTEKSDILKSAQFLICIGLVIFFTYRLFVELALKFSVTGVYFKNTFIIQSYVNLFVNFIFAFAILCLPKTRIFTSSSSSPQSS